MAERLQDSQTAFSEFNTCSITITGITSSTHTTPQTVPTVDGRYQASRRTRMKSYTNKRRGFPQCKSWSFTWDCSGISAHLWHLQDAAPDCGSRSYRFSRNGRGPDSRNHAVSHEDEVSMYDVSNVVKTIEYDNFLGIEYGPHSACVQDDGLHPVSWVNARLLTIGK